MNHIKVVDKQDCCGCTACGNVCPKQCIAMEADKLGFVYPKVDEDKCIECGLCEKVCPFINPFDALEPVQSYAAYNKGEQELLKSSSGGIFISLARQTIENGGIVFGAVFNDDWSVSHCSADTIEGVIPMMTSKYLQSKMLNCFDEAQSYLKEGRQVLFTGTPCQIAGLKHFLRKDYPGLLTVEVICHGVPSPAVWQNYLKEKFARPKGGPGGKNTVLLVPKHYMLAIASINFRDKRDGWKKYGFAASPLISVYGDEKNSVLPPNDFYEPFNENAYMKAFLRNWSLRPSCFKCQAKSGKSHADITIGDFWGIEKWENVVANDKGTSCVISRTLRGEEALKKLQYVYFGDVTYDQILAGNPSLEQSVVETKQAKTFRRIFPKRGFARTMSKLEHIPIYKRLLISLCYRVSLISKK